MPFSTTSVLLKRNFYHLMWFFWPWLSCDSFGHDYHLNGIPFSIRCSFLQIIKFFRQWNCNIFPRSAFSLIRHRCFRTIYVFTWHLFLRLTSILYIYKTILFLHTTLFFNTTSLTNKKMSLKLKHHFITDMHCPEDIRIFRFYMW